MKSLLETTSFLGRTFYCSRDAFLPTAQTGRIVEAALDYLKKRESSPDHELMVLDIGTGCGNLAITLALHLNCTTIFASDINADAIELAKRNVAQYELQHRVFPSAGDLFSPFRLSGFEGKIDLIICNPPYIPTGSLQKLPHGIDAYGPLAALDGGPFGVSFYRRLISEAVPLLKPEGMLLFETGENQETLIRKMFEKNREYKEVTYYHSGEKIRAISAIKNNGQNGEGYANLQKMRNE